MAVVLPKPEPQGGSSNAQQVKKGKGWFEGWEAVEDAGFRTRGVFLKPHRFIIFPPCVYLCAFVLPSSVCLFYPSMGTKENYDLMIGNTHENIQGSLDITLASLWLIASFT